MLYATSHAIYHSTCEGGGGGACNFGAVMFCKINLCCMLCHSLTPYNRKCVECIVNENTSLLQSKMRDGVGVGGMLLTVLCNFGAVMFCKINLCCMPWDRLFDHSETGMGNNGGGHAVTQLADV